jgi:hypothetical protein
MRVSNVSNWQAVRMPTPDQLDTSTVAGTAGVCVRLKLNAEHTVERIDADGTIDCL